MHIACDSHQRQYSIVKQLLQEVLCKFGLQQF